jgi:hypothetical protein
MNERDKRILKALQDAEMWLNTQYGMVMFDAAAPEETLVIDNSTIVAELNSVISDFFVLEMSTLEQKILTAIDGHSADDAREAMLLVMHRSLGWYQFGRLLLGSNFR